MKKLLSSALILVLTLVVLFPAATRGAMTQSLGLGQMTYVVASTGIGPRTVDPAMGYDTATNELIRNVYDPLVFFAGTGNDVVPWLADSYSISTDGQTYTFHIRSGVQWQDPAYGTVTPADVEYSFERLMVRDYTDGPAWTFWHSIFGQYVADLDNPMAQGIAIDNAVTSNATHVTIHFSTGFPYPSFKWILAQTWASILCKQWCIDHGDWNPSVDKLSDGTWVNAHNPATSPLDGPPCRMMGSGPFKFNYLDAAVSWSILRNTNFWGGWGTDRLTRLGFPSTITRGYVNEIVEYFIADYATRLAGFLGSNPIYDSIVVPKENISSVWMQPDIRCYGPLVSQVVEAVFFSYNVSMSSPYIGSPSSDTYFGELGIRPDFFSDIHCRKAIAYSLNRTQFIQTAYSGEAAQVGIPLPSAGYEPYYNGSPALMYTKNTANAIAEWQLAWGGAVWTNGFEFSIPYNAGNLARKTVADMLKAELEAQNPKFHVDVVEVSSYGDVWQGGSDGHATSPIYQLGWLADYPDPDDWTIPFMSPTSGVFAYPQHLDMDPNAALFENLIRWGARNATINGRNANYQTLWKLYHDQAASLPLENLFDRRFARDWVKGWYYNSNFPGIFGYPLWKEDTIETIHIRPDGSVDPPTSKIQRQGDVYTFTGNISSEADGIYIERDNMTLEGAGYTIRGSGIGVGIVTGGYMHNLTIKDTNIENFYYGIFCNATGTLVSKNNITGNTYGIMLFGYSRANVTENRLANNTYNAIDVEYASNNTISANTIEYNGEGIQLLQSTNNTIQGNNIQGCAYSGISLIFSSSNNQIFRNIVRENNNAGIAFNGTDSVNNAVFENNLIGNTWGLWSCTSNSNNKIWHNSFVNNTDQVFNLNFGNESVNTWDDGYPSGGNYWTNYNGTDTHNGPFQNLTGSDGIGDTPQFIDMNNTDRYPLMGHFTWQGQNVTVSPRSDVDITFANVTAQGQTTAEENATGPTPPSGFNAAGQYFDIKTTASYSGKITLGFTYDDSMMSQVMEENLRLTHWNATSGQWEDITSRVDTTNNIIYGETSSLSIFTTHSIQPLDQDIVVAEEDCSKSLVGQGYATTINVTLRNGGGTIKTFDVNVYAHAASISVVGTQTVTNLGVGQETTLKFTFQTFDLPKGNYTLIVGDNQTGWIILAMVGDVAGKGTFPNTLPDGKVDIKDLAAIAKCYGANYPDPKYVANYDLTGPTLGSADGKIDIRDLAAAAKNYGKNDP